MDRARLDKEAIRRAHEVARIARVQEHTKQELKGEALRQAQQVAGLTQAQRDF